MRLAGLAPRDRRVVLLAAQGKTTQEIADEIGMTQNNVCTTLSRLYRALGVLGQAGLVPWVLRQFYDLPAEPTHDLPGCTPRQREVVRRVALGYRDKEIAADLGLGLTTVRREVMALLRARGRRNRVELARWAWDVTLAQAAARQARRAA